MKQIIKKLRQKDGMSYPFVVCIVLALLIMTLGICEVIRLNIISANVRNKFQSVIISETTDNFSYMYQPIRDGYASSFRYDDGSWEVGTITKRARIINSLNDYFSTGEAGQITVESVSYRVSMTNVAPTNPNTATQYNLRGEVVVQVPYEFLWSGLPPIELTVNVRSQWRQMF